MTPQIIVKRCLYEEPDHLQLELFISNGRFCGNTNFYCHAEDLRTIGLALQNFPSKIGEYCYEVGSEKPEDRY